MFFTNMGPTLKTGFNVLGGMMGSTAAWVGEKVGYATEYWRDKLYPAPQKTQIRPSVVSNQPYEQFGVARPIIGGATTLGQRFQNWWGTAKDKAISIYDKVKTTFQGQPVKSMWRKNMNVLADTFSNITTGYMSTLPAYFQQKWGLLDRPYQGDIQSNTPVYKAREINQNSTQSNAPATLPTLASFWDMLRSGTQPVQTFGLAYPQQEPIPVSSGIGTEQKRAGNFMPLILIGGGLIAVWFIARRSK